MPRPFIVDVSEVLSAAQLRDEHWTIVKLTQHLGDAESSLQWCAKRKLLRNSMLCALCNVHMSLINRKTTKEGKLWKCYICKGKVSVRDGSLFQRSHLTILQMLLVINHWARELPQSIAGEEVEASVATLTEWFNFCREECTNWLYRNPIQLGGFDEDGQPLVVEIDECQFSQGRQCGKKYFNDGHRVFGGIERKSGKCFLVELNDHSTETLEGTILRHVLPGTHIVSSGWRLYSNLENLESGVYMHSVVTHKRNFVDEDDGDIHTQTMQNLWMRIKRKMRMQFGTSRDLFPKYLLEFMWRCAINRENVFASILISLSESFPVE